MKYILILFLILLLSGCAKSIAPESTGNITFSNLDINKDGSIDKVEFKQAKSENSIDAETPMIWFGVIMGTTCILLFFSSLKKCNSKKCLK